MRAIPGINEPTAAFAFLALLETIKSLDGDIMITLSFHGSSIEMCCCVCSVCGLKGWNLEHMNMSTTDNQYNQWKPKLANEGKLNMNGQG